MYIYIFGVQNADCCNIFFSLLLWGNDQQVFTQICVQCFLAHKLELVPTTICRSIQQRLKNIYKPLSLLLFLKVSALQ
jgi:hypothetical protein